MCVCGASVGLGGGGRWIALLLSGGGVRLARLLGIGLHLGGCGVVVMMLGWGDWG